MFLGGVEKWVFLGWGSKVGIQRQPNLSRDGNSLKYRHSLINSLFIKLCVESRHKG